MDIRHNKRTCSSISSDTSSILDLLSSNLTVQRTRMVCKSILKRFIVPYSVVTSAYLMLTFKSAKASTLSDIVLQKSGALTHNYTGSGGGLLELPKTVIHNLDIITSYIMKGLDFINNLPGSIPKLTADLLTTIFHFLSNIILQTPLFIFNNPYLKNTSLTFALISITLVTILTVFESLMQILNKKHTNFKTIIKRWLLVASVSGFVPFAFESGFNFINKLTTGISKIGSMDGGNPNGLIYGESIGWFDTLVIILFDATAISMLIPICLQAGRRWWDLLVLCAVSPLALSSYCFDRHKHYFDKWIDSVKTHSLTQLVYAVYILMMGIIIFSTQSIQGGFITLAIKILLVIAGLNKLAHPPQFIKKMTDNGSDVFDEYDKTKRTFKDMYETITFKNFRPTQFYKQRLEDKQKKIQSLRKKNKRRYVGDLL